jgi:hypothetical protein
MKLLFDIIISLTCLIACIYVLLIAYHVIPLNTKDPEKAQLWHRKFDKIMKIAGVIGIIGFILTWIGHLITYFEGK